LGLETYQQGIDRLDPTTRIIILVPSFWRKTQQEYPGLWLPLPDRFEHQADALRDGIRG
jgi:hypothetical protein